MRVGDRIECRIEKNVYGGMGLARINGIVVFVEGAYKGENVSATICEIKKRFVRAVAREASVPGMVYEGVSPDAELDFKREQLEEFLYNIPHPPVEVVEGLPIEQYRNKVVYHYDSGVIGYRREPSHQVVDIRFDPLAVPEINAALPDIRREALAKLAVVKAEGKMSAFERKASMNLTIRWTRNDGVVWWTGVRRNDAPPLLETTAGLDFEVPQDGFYQVNPVAHDALTAAVRDAYLENNSAEIFDLYCGVGVFGIVCAKAASSNYRLTGVEFFAPALKFARNNAKRNEVKGRFIAGRVGMCLDSLKCADNATVIVDPPRGGLEGNVARWLAGCNSARIFYVSCDPATLKRDLTVICGQYRIKRVRLFNMFPCTARFETFVELVRKNG